MPEHDAAFHGWANAQPAVPRAGRPSLGQSGQGERLDDGFHPE